MNHFDDAKSGVPQKGLTQGEAKSLIESLKGKTLNSFKDNIVMFNSTKVFKPDFISRYDIIYDTIFGIPHPILIFKKDKEYCYGIVLSSTDGPHCIYKINKSRFFKDSYATITLYRNTEEAIVKKWIGVFDAKNEADLIIKNFKEQIKSL